MPTSNCLNKRGQSLVELAIFSTIILMVMGFLVSYGLSYSHNQRVMMMAFRRAQKLAGEVAGTYRNASITLAYDRAIADPASMFGFTPKTPFSFSYSAIRSNDLYAELDATYTEIMPRDIPRVVYDINGKVYKLTTAAIIDPKAFILPRKVKEYLDEGEWGEGDKCWKITEETGDPPANSSWDIDDDGKEELVISGYRVMDSQEGELDMTEEDTNRKNGLLGQIRTNFMNRSSLTNTQEGGRISTATRINYFQIVERKVRLNPELWNLEADAPTQEAHANALADINQQIAENNQNCYGRGIPCIAEEEDNIVEEAGERFLVVRSRFSSGENENRYLWSVEQ